MLNFPINLFDLAGIGFIIIVGCIAHFLYEWTHHSRLMGYFTAVNESTWEHLKLLITPSFIWLIAEAHTYGGNPNLLFAHFSGLLAGLIFIPTFFYAYQARTHRDLFLLDILAFVLGAIVEQAVFVLVLNNLALPDPYQNIFLHIGALGLILIFLYYITHTYAPEHNYLSRDPITKQYGPAGHFDGKPKKPNKLRKPNNSKPNNKLRNSQTKSKNRRK